MLEIDRSLIVFYKLGYHTNKCMFVMQIGVSIYTLQAESEFEPNQIYHGIDEYTKLNIVRLNKGDLVLVHPAFRYPIKIKFPRALFVKP